jgi:Uncharacterized Fe-S center protein
MPSSLVYFADMSVTEEENLQAKLLRLITTAGMERLDFPRKFVAIKIHFGELGNLAYLRPNYAKTVVDFIRAHDGKPFLTDANTLYVGGRKNALDHLETAYVNGFSPFSTGCHILIADGLKGNDECEVPVPGGEVVKTAKISRAIMDADIIISLNHFKCHELTGIGGAVKNIGMGCGSRAGKMVMHSNGKPQVDQKVCVGCGKCNAICAFDAPKVANGKACIDHAVCVGCGRCISICPVDAIDAAGDASNDDLNKKMAEYTVAVLHGRPHFHISFVTDVSPFCDCHAENDVPIVPNIGMFASFDPVALDWACADAVNSQKALPGSLLDRVGLRGNDHFSSVHPATDWRGCLDHCVKLGVGKKEYELVAI